MRIDWICKYASCPEMRMAETTVLKPKLKSL